MIDGFPRSVEQATFFEQNVLECQTILYYEVPQEVMLERCLKRAAEATEKRSDDNPETLKKRVETYFDQTLPVIDFYQKFGKVNKIDATGEIGDVYAMSKNAVLPQVMFMLGPKASGKSNIAEDVANRTNMRHLDFDKFVADKGLKDCDDETVSIELINELASEQMPRVCLENFPQNIT